MLSVSQLYKSLGQAHEFELALIKEGVIVTSIQDFIDGKLSISFVPRIETKAKAKWLNFTQLLSWFRKNDLEWRFPGGFEGQIVEQEKFYRKFYGDDFRIDRRKIRVDKKRLPAIKAGLEAGCLNYAMLKVTPEALIAAEMQMTGAEFFYSILAYPLKKEGFKIWAEKGTDRWTNLTLGELLKRCNPAEPEEFDAEALKKDWVAEEKNVIAKKSSAPKVQAGMMEIVFTSNLADIPSDQKIVNKNGELVALDNRSYVAAIAKNVRVLSHSEGIILACQMFANDKSYLARNTWEWRRDLVDHRDKNDSPPVSVAIANSDDGGLDLYSGYADDSNGSGRLRLAL